MATELTIPDAVNKARQYLKELLPEYAAAPWHLEEVETASESRWCFTFSAIIPSEGGSAQNLADILRGVRLSKSVELEPQTGKLLAVRNKAA